jgi:hypothetical protein
LVLAVLVVQQVMALLVVIQCFQQSHQLVAVVEVQILVLVVMVVQVAVQVVVFQILELV